MCPLIHLIADRLNYKCFQVHTSDLPLLFDMTKCLVIAMTMSIIGAGGALLLLVSPSLVFTPMWGRSILHIASLSCEKPQTSLLAPANTD